MKIKLILTVLLGVLIILLVYGTYNFYTSTQETISVGYLPSNHDSALFVAKAGDYFQQADIKVQLVPFRTGSEIIDAANKNLIDLGYCEVTPVTDGISRNISIKIVAAVNQECSGIVVSKKDNITNISQLAGKSFFIPKNSGIQDVLFRILLRNNNIDNNI
ncbi:MAG: ABC transporter substrate-binding protein [Methanobacterium sp.]|nr:ABC transporter substrate-binding protein [Methanobacterium sp.]